MAVKNFETARVEWDNSQFFVWFTDLFGQPVSKEIVLSPEAMRDFKDLIETALKKYDKGDYGGRDGYIEE